MPTRVKICCIANADEAALAIELGASALGLVAEMPSGPGVISDEVITQLTPIVPPGVDSFLLTSRTDVAGIIAHQQATGANTLQLVDALATGTYQDIRMALPGIRIVQVIHVLDQASVDEALRIAPQVDALLLDSGNPTLAVKELGGTGRTHNWTLSRAIVEQSPKPVFLAGGLKASNIGEAIRSARPFGVDLCSGVRTNGQLDRKKLQAFMQAVTEADRSLLA